MRASRRWIADVVALLAAESAWYRGRKLRRACRSIVFVLLACGALFVTPARAQDLGNCQSSRQWTWERLGEYHIKLTGQVEIQCGTESMSADQVELFTDTHNGHRHRQRRLHQRLEPHRGRSPRIQHRDENRDVLQRVRDGHAAGAEEEAGRRGARPAGVALRRPGAGRLFLRREGLEDRAREVPPDQGRLHDLRAADAALAADVRHGRPQPRSLRGAHQRALQGEGHAGAVPADHVLPDQQGGSRVRVPDALVRELHDPRDDAEQRLLLGDQPQPGCDVPL